MAESPLASTGTPAGGGHLRGRAASFRLRPLPPDRLSWPERTVSLGRWLALAVLVAASRERLAEPNALSLLLAASLYLCALEASMWLGGRARRWALLVSASVDLLAISWASYTFGAGPASLYYVVILSAALRHGARITLLVGTASLLLYLLVALSLEGTPAATPDHLIQMLALSGTTMLAGYLADLKEKERRERVRLGDAERSKSDLVSLVSHEVRTPLAMIKGAVDLLLDGGPGPVSGEQRTFLITISDSCERLIGLVEDLLARAWVEAGKLELKMSTLDARVPVRNAVRAFRPLAARKGQEVHLDYPQVLSSVNADEYWIYQVVVNLLSNAGKYTTEGGHIYVSVAENQSHVLVSVTDDGAGMSREERERMFEPFFRGSRRDVAGTGLGLAIVQYVVEKHGGKVLVDTSLGQGTTFLFTLPK